LREKFRFPEFQSHVFKGFKEGIKFNSNPYQQLIITIKTAVLQTLQNQVSQPFNSSPLLTQSPNDQHPTPPSFQPDNSLLKAKIDPCLSSNLKLLDKAWRSTLKARVRRQQIQDSRGDVGRNIIVDTESLPVAKDGLIRGNGILALCLRTILRVVGAKPEGALVGRALARFDAGVVTAAGDVVALGTTCDVAAVAPGNDTLDSRLIFTFQ
jgi:hypothetical protein